MNPAAPGGEIVLVRPHEIDIGDESGGWPAVVRDVRVIGPIVRVELSVEGRSPSETLEAEVSREQYDARRYHVGQKVGVRFRRWQIYPANVVRRPTDAAPAAG
jgi:ABC-type sulfate/molybdate transport systems ATPase subunit